MLTKELLVNYHTRRIEDLELCHKALASGDFIEIERIGHKLKGNGAMFGFPELSAIGDRMESYSKAGNAPEITKSVKELESWIEENKKGL